MYWQYLIIPLLSSIFGWLLIRILLYGVFHPLKPRKVAGITWQGVLPKMQPGLAEKLGKLAAVEFQQSLNLEEKINDPGTLQKLMPLIEGHVDDFLRVKLKAEIPMIGMLVGDKMIASFKKVFMKEIEILFPVILTQFAGNLSDELPIEKIVSQKIRDVSPVAIESQLRPTVFNRLEWLGAILGLLFGFLELGILLLSFEL